MGSHARWQVAVVAGAIGTVTVVAGGGASVAQACSTSAPCSSTEHMGPTGFFVDGETSVLRLQSWYLPSYTAGERIDLHYKAGFQSISPGAGATIGSLDAGVAVGGPLVATPFNTSTPVYYKRTQMVGASPVEINYTDGPGTGYFAAGTTYSAPSDCWTVVVGPHTSPCLGPLPNQIGTSDEGLSTNSAATNYKAKADMYGTVHYAGYSWDTWPPFNLGFRRFEHSGSGATCANYDSTTLYTTVGIGTGVTC